MKRSKSLYQVPLPRPGVRLLARTTEVTPECLVLETSVADLKTCLQVLSPQIKRNSKNLYLVRLLASNKILFGYSACETQVVELNELQAEYFSYKNVMRACCAAGHAADSTLDNEGFQGISFLPSEGSINFKWELIGPELKDRLIYIVQSIKRVETFADEVYEYYKAGKKHHAFSLLATAIYPGEYRNVYNSKINPGRQGIVAIGLDLIRIGTEARLGFDLLYFAVNPIYSLVPIAEFTRETLPVGFFSLPGSTKIHEDGFMFDDDRMLYYLRSVTAEDIAESNVAVFAILALSLLFRNEGLLDTAPVFSIFSRDRYDKLCLRYLENVDFRKSFNRKIDDSEADLQAFSLDYPEVVFLVIRQAYAHGCVDLSCKSSILWQILCKDSRCAEFKDYIGSIYSNVINYKLAKVAQAFLSCTSPFVRDFLALDPSRLNALQNVSVVSRTPAPSLDMSSRLLRTPAVRGTVESIRAEERARLLKEIIDFVRSKMIPASRHRGVQYFPPPRVDKDAAILNLCNCVVKQFIGGADRKQLLARLTEQGGMIIMSPPDDEEIAAFLQPYVTPDNSDFTIERSLEFAYHQLMGLLQRPIILTHKDDRDGHKGERVVKYSDYVLTGAVDKDVSNVRDLVNKVCRPIIVLAENLSLCKKYVDALFKVHNSNVCVVLPNGTAVLHEIEEYRKLCNHITLRYIDENNRADKEVELRQWVTDNNTTHNILLLRRNVDPKGWYIYARNSNGLLLRNALIESNTKLGELLCDKDISQAGMLLEGDRVLLTAVTEFLNLPLSGFLPVEPLRISPDCEKEVKDLRALWLSHFESRLSDSLENNISISAAFLMLELDCFVPELRRSRAEVREYIECLGNQPMRLEIVNIILGMIANSPVYKSLAVFEEEPAAASTSVAKSLDLG